MSTNQWNNSSPGEIFQNVCNDIGEHFSNEGFKYAPSSPKMTKKDNDHKLEIRFNSSSSNYADGFINLEINSNLYSLELAKKDPSKSKFKGLITGVTTPLSRSLPEGFPDSSRIVEKMDGEIVKFPKDRYKNREYIYNRNVNLFKIDDKIYNEIIAFIETRIIAWYDRFQSNEEMVSLIHQMGASAKNSIDRENFYEYLELRGIQNIPSIKTEIKNR